MDTCGHARKMAFRFANTVYLTATLSVCLFTILVICISSINAAEHDMSYDKLFHCQVAISFWLQEYARCPMYSLLESFSQPTSIGIVILQWPII